MENSKADKIKVAFTREEINGISIVLRAFMKSCMDINIGREALNFYTKILKYGRPYLYHNIEYVAVFFYRSEFASLMKMISLFAYAGTESNEEYYDKIGKCESDEYVLSAVKALDGIE